jgi:hypothetical protein
MSNIDQPNPRQEISLSAHAPTNGGAPKARVAESGRIVKKGARRASWIVAAVWLGWGGFFPFYLIPRFQSIFRDMLRGQELPVLTTYVFWMNPTGWVLIVGSVAGALIYRGMRGNGAVLSICAAVLLIVVTGAIAVALHLPLFKIGGGLSSGD